jgi:hypothetical protein
MVGHETEAFPMRARNGLSQSWPGLQAAACEYWIPGDRVEGTRMWRR